MKSLHPSTIASALERIASVFWSSQPGEEIPGSSPGLVAAPVQSAAVEHSVMQDMQRCCSECADKRKCEEELAEPNRTQASQTAKWPSYCPNETTLTALMGPTCH